MKAAAGAPSAKPAAASRPFPFRTLMRTVLSGCAMAPDAFWRLSVPEVTAMLAPGSVPDAAPRARDLERLMERFPDAR